MQKEKIIHMYELIYIVGSDVSEEKETVIKTKIKDLISNYEGNIKSIADWGKKKLAYEIAKENKGRYFYVLFEALPSIVAELERVLRLNENILRFITVKVSQEELDRIEIMKKRLEENKLEGNPR